MLTQDTWPPKEQSGTGRDLQERLTYDSVNGNGRTLTNPSRVSKMTSTGRESRGYSEAERRYSLGP